MATRACECVAVKRQGRSIQFKMSRSHRVLAYEVARSRPKHCWKPLWRGPCFFLRLMHNPRTARRGS